MTTQEDVGIALAAASLVRFWSHLLAIGTKPEFIVALIEAAVDYEPRFATVTRTITTHRGEL